MLSTLSKIRKSGRPSHILSFGDSLGDNLLLTTLARELNARGFKNVWIKCDHPKLFGNNPYVKLVLPYNTLLSTTVLNLLGVKTASPRYTTYHKETDRDKIPEKHIILKMADSLGLKGKIDTTPNFFFEGDEAQQGKLADRQIVITTSTSGSLVSMANKEWYAQRYQQVVDSFYPEYQFVQLGAKNDAPLNNVIDMRGRSTLRESAAILKNSLLAVTHVGFTMHLARAVNCPAVVIYGGRETPAQSGYSCFNNIYSPIHCSPCWLHNTCHYNKQCMDMISAATVISAIKQQLQNPSPLVADELYND